MIKKILIFLTLVFLTPIVINAVEIKTEWQNAWGGNSNESFSSMVQNGNGEIITCGFHSSGLPYQGARDASIVKYNKDGVMMSQVGWGGNKAESFNDLLYTSDDELVVVGESGSFELEGLDIKADDAIIIKYDKNENIVWKKNFGGGQTDYFEEVVETTDKGYVTVGSFFMDSMFELPNNGFYDGMIVKFDKDGNILWKKSWGGSTREHFFNIIKSTDESLIVSGIFMSTDIEGIEHEDYNDSNVIVIKYDKDGNMIWQKVWGGNGEEKYNEMLQLPNNEFIAIGRTSSNNIESIQNKGGKDAVLVKYDENGNVLWQKSWGGSGDDEFYSIAQTSDGGFIVAGSFDSTDISGLDNKGGKDIVFIRYDKEGNVIWQKNWGGNSNESVSEILLMSDKNFVISGSTMSTNIEGLNVVGGTDSLVIKLNVEYNIENNKTNNGTYTTVQQDDRAIINPTPDKDYKVEKVIVKDNQGNEIETTLQEDGTYSFPLYTDVIVDVLFALAIDNPKTGIIDLMTILFVGIFMSLSGFLIVKKYNERLEF